MADLAAKHFVLIQELTAHNTGSTQETPVQEVPSVIAYTPFIISGLLFIAAFGMFIINRTKSIRNITTAIGMALVIAGIPAIMQYVANGTRQNALAGPDEIPRQVVVVPESSGVVVISWHTDAPHKGVVRFGVAPLSEQTARVYMANDQTEVTDHEVRIEGVKKGKTYEFEILSGTTWYDNGGAPIKFIDQ